MVNEVLCKLICHNICVLIQETHELGVEVDFQKKLIRTLIVCASESSVRAGQQVLHSTNARKYLLRLDKMPSC
jgi:hypothetical protein